MIKITHLLKLLSDTNRLRILQLLNKRKLCVCELAHVLGVTQPSVSRHLKKLKAAGLVEQEQSGFWTDYYMKVENKQEKVILDSVFKLIDGHEVLEKDVMRLAKADRRKLCCP